MYPLRGGNLTLRQWNPRVCTVTNLPDNLTYSALENTKAWSLLGGLKYHFAKDSIDNMGSFMNFYEMTTSKKPASTYSNRIDFI